MANNGIKDKDKGQNGVEHATLLFGYLTILMREKNGNVCDSFLDPPNLEGPKMGVLGGKEGTPCPSLAIPLPPLKLLPSMVHLNLAIPLHATPSIATLSNTP